MRKNLFLKSKRPLLWLMLMVMSMASGASAASMILPSSTENDSLSRVFNWRCEGEKRTCSVHIDDSILAYYRYDRDHLAYQYSSFNGDDKNAPANYYSFVLSDPGRATVRDLAQQLVSDTMTQAERIPSALTFVQALPYSKDRNSKGVEEYVRYPLETLADGTGDCEDKSMLLAALFAELDLDYVLLAIPDHLAVGVCCDSIEAGQYFAFGGKQYYYLETTNRNWKIGQIPKEHQKQRFEIYPPSATPTLIVKGVWFESAPALPLQKADCTLKVELFNSGPCVAAGLSLEALMVKLDYGREEGVGAFPFLLEDLQEGEDRTFELHFKSLIPQQVVLRMRLSGTTVDPQQFELKMTKRRFH